MATSDIKRLSVTPVVSQTSSKTGALVLKSWVEDFTFGVLTVNAVTVALDVKSARVAIEKTFMITDG